MFFLSDLSTADFDSPLSGVVSRLDPRLLVRPHKGKAADSGEWGGPQHASWLLSMSLARLDFRRKTETKRLWGLQANAFLIACVTTSFTLPRC